MIGNTSDKIIDEYKRQFGVEVTISRNLERFIEMRQKGEAERGIEISPAQYIAFADSALLISLFLASAAGLTAIIRITRYEPIKILMERN